jgi:hypothetical protein
MSQDDAWIYLDGPEPEDVHAFLDALRDLPAAAPEDMERLAGAFFEALDAELGYAPEEPLDPPHLASAAPAGYLAASLVAPPASVPLPSDPAPATSPAPLAGGLLMPQVVRPPAALAITAPMETPAVPPAPAAALPFTKEAVPVARDAPPRPRAPKTLEVPVIRDPRLAETAPLGDDSILKAIAAVPFLGSTLGNGAIPIPRLKLNEYASLCAELAVHPERAAAVLPHYHVLSETARRALDQHWQKDFTDHPETAAAFETLLAKFTYFLRSSPGKPR